MKAQVRQFELDAADVDAAVVRRTRELIRVEKVCLCEYERQSEQVSVESGPVSRTPGPLRHERRPRVPTGHPSL